MMAALASAAVVAAVAWSGRAFVTWIRAKQDRLKRRDELEHAAKLEQCDDDKGGR